MPQPFLNLLQLQTRSHPPLNTIFITQAIEKTLLNKPRKNQQQMKHKYYAKILNIVLGFEGGGGGTKPGKHA
jgi:hypothetical protein